MLNKSKPTKVRLRTEAESIKLAYRKLVGELTRLSPGFRDFDYRDWASVACAVKGGVLTVTTKTKCVKVDNIRLYRIINIKVIKLRELTKRFIALSQTI